MPPHDIPYYLFILDFSHPSQTYSVSVYVCVWQGVGVGVGCSRTQYVKGYTNYHIFGMQIAPGRRCVRYNISYCTSLNMCIMTWLGIWTVFPFAMLEIVIWYKILFEE